MPYIKAILAVVVSAAGALVQALGPPGDTIGDLDAKHWLIAIATVLGSGGLVWFTENVPGVFGGAIKTIIAFLTAGVASLVVALDDNHITQAEWLVAFTAAVVATGLVYQFSDKKAVTT